MCLQGRVAFAFCKPSDANGPVPVDRGHWCVRGRADRPFMNAAFASCTDQAPGIAGASRTLTLVRGRVVRGRAAPTDAALGGQERPAMG